MSNDNSTGKEAESRNELIRLNRRRWLPTVLLIGNHGGCQSFRMITSVRALTPLTADFPEVATVTTSRVRGSGRFTSSPRSS